MGLSPGARMKTYDVGGIGGGPAGYVAAIRAAQLGLRTCLVEKEWLGGVCLNVGCIPSKALLRNAELVYLVRERAAEFGLIMDNLRLDYSAAVKRSRQVAARLTKGVAYLMQKNGIEVYLSTARLTGRTAEGQVRVALADGTELTVQHLILATGASPVVPSGWEVDGRQVLTYRQAILQETLPARAVIIGGGAIGVEFATIWNAYGVAVTVVEMMPHLLPNEDEEAAAELGKAFKKRGIKVLEGTRVEALERDGELVRVRVASARGAQVLEAEQVLLAMGFRPTTAGLGLETLGVPLDERGAVVIDERMATPVPGVWAIGDVTGKLMLAHVGSAMGIVAAEAIAGVETVKLDYTAMPRAVYSFPQVASFGLTEAQARARGYPVKTARFPFQANCKALGLGEPMGWVKLVVDEHYGELLGATLVGPEVTELLPELTLAHMMELTPAEIARNVHAHPTLAEALMEAAHGAEGHGIHL